MYIASLAMSVQSLVEGALKHVRSCRNSLRSRAKKPWLPWLLKSDVLNFEAVSFPIVDYWYGKVWVVINSHEAIAAVFGDIVFLLICRLHR